MCIGQAYNSFVLLNPDKYSFENSVDPDQLASDEKLNSK